MVIGQVKPPSVERRIATFAQEIGLAVVLDTFQVTNADCPVFHVKLVFGLVTANAVVVSSSQISIPIIAGTVEVLTFNPNAYFTGITSSGTAVVYVTPGDGL